MNVCCMSDMHGYLDFDIPEADLYLIAGDVCPVWDHTESYQLEWLHSDFKAFLERLGMERVLWVGGNHDLALERPVCPLDDNLRETYLVGEAKERAGLKVWGSPWSTPFGNWAFMLNEKIADSIYGMIPEDVDIIISHGPPYGFGDMVVHYNDMVGLKLNEPFVRHTGSKKLRNSIKQIQPKLVVTGHIHECYGLHPINMGQKEIPVANVSVLDVEYELVNKPMVFTF